MITKRVCRLLAATCAAGLLAGMAFAQSEALILHHLRAFLRTPEVFADRPLGYLAVTGQRSVYTPPGWVWYLHYNGSLRGMEMDEIISIASSRGVPGLSFEGNRTFNGIHLRALRSLPELQLLNLAGTSIQEGDYRLLNMLYKLQALTLNNQMTDASMPVLERLPYLVELGLAGTKITDRGLSSVRRLLNLQRVDLGDTAVTDAGLTHLKTLRLRSIRLGPRITDAAAPRLVWIRTLQQLDLQQTQMTDRSLPVLSKLLRVHTLFLGRGITDQGVRSLSLMRSLKRLDLTGTSVTDAGMESLSKLDQLEELALSNTRVGDAGLSRFTTLSRLRYLEVSNTAMTPSGLKVLAAIPSLQVISMSWKGKPSIQDLLPLAALPKLHTIIINGDPLAASVLEQLHARASKHSWLNRFEKLWVADVEAAEDEGPAPDNIEVAQLPSSADDMSSGRRFSGLKRIHVVESELENVIPAVEKPAIHVQEDTEKNFLGEFTVGATSSKSKNRPTAPN